MDWQKTLEEMPERFLNQPHHSIILVSLDFYFKQHIHGYFRIFTLPIRHIAFELCSIEENCSRDAVRSLQCAVESTRKNIMLSVYMFVYFHFMSQPLVHVS